jgi:hypothetical protein
MKRCTSASTPDPRAPAPLSRPALWTVRRWWAPPRSLWTWDTSHRWVYQGHFSQVGVCDGQFPLVSVSGTETVLTGGYESQFAKVCASGKFSLVGVSGALNSHRWVYM